MLCFVIWSKQNKAQHNHVYIFWDILYRYNSYATCQVGNIDVNKISIRHFHIGSISNRRRSEGLCHLGNRLIVAYANTQDTTMPSLRNTINENKFLWCYDNIKKVFLIFLYCMSHVIHCMFEVYYNIVNIEYRIHPRKRILYITGWFSPS